MTWALPITPTIGFLIASARFFCTPLLRSSSQSHFRSPKLRICTLWLQSVHFVAALIIAGRLSWQIFLIRRDIGAVPPDPVEPDEGTASKAVWRSLKLLRRSPTSSPLQAAFRGRSKALPRRVSRGNVMTNSHRPLTNYRLSVRVERPILGSNRDGVTNGERHL